MLQRVWRENVRDQAALGHVAGTDFSGEGFIVDGLCRHRDRCVDRPSLIEFAVVAVHLHLHGALGRFE